MANLKELRKRLKSVTETKKITTAMKLVAASKFRRAQVNAMQTEAYKNRLQDLFSQAVHYARLEGMPLPELLGASPQQRIYCVLTAERGLCGSFNAQVIRLALATLARSSDSQGAAPSHPPQLILLGNRGIAALRPHYRANVLGDCSMTSMKAEAIYEQLHSTIMPLMPAFMRAGLSNIYVIYNVFESAIKQQAVCVPLVPLPDLNLPLDTPPLFEIEPFSRGYFERIIRDQIMARLYACWLMTAMGEQGARMFAMDNATRNADEMITKLRITYNRTRQAKITTELTEIISGAEALV